MHTAPLREDEADSLSALMKLEILDTGAEPEFDALAHAAATVCEVPTALVSLIDADRQWFKARVGFDGPAETARSLSFCSHAVLQDELLVIEDASQDERFVDHPHVRGEPHIRFYAAAPLRLSTGVRIGTLCVMDSVPRQLDPGQRGALERLGIAVVRALEGRSAIRLLQRTPASVASAASNDPLEVALRNVDAAMQDLSTSAANEATAATSMRADEQSKRSAIKLCLTSSATLLGITRQLLKPEQPRTAAEKESVSKRLADDTKVAGRAAYRAGLVLTDPFADAA